MNMFETRTMLQALEQAFTPTTFLRDTFFSNVQEFDTAVVDMDIELGGQSVAPFVHPSIGGKLVDREGYTTKTYQPPELSPERLTTAEDLMNRQVGETVYSTRSPMERAAVQLAKDLRFLDNIITRREEVMAAEALFTGQVTVKGDGYDEVVKYWKGDASDPFTQLSGTSRWSQSGSDIIASLEAASDKIANGSGLTGVNVVLGSDAAKYLMSHEKTLKLHNRRVQLGQIDPRTVPAGAKYLGDLAGFSLWTYNRVYKDPVTKALTPYVPLDKVLIAGEGAMTTMAYGACALFRDDTEEMIVAGRRVPDSWKQRKNPAGRLVQIKSRPLPIINQIDGFHVLKVHGAS